MEGQCVSCEVRRGACMLFQIRSSFKRINFYFGSKYTLHLNITPQTIFIAYLVFGL